MNAHVDTLFVLDDAGRLQTVNEPPYSAPAPYVFIGVTEEGVVWRFRDKINDHLCARLQAVGVPFQPLSEHTDVRVVAAIREILKNEGLRVGTVWSGPAYYLAKRPRASPVSTVTVDGSNSRLLMKHFLHVVPELPYNWPCIAVVRDGDAVSVCRTVRRSAGGAEAGVQTADSYRDRGHAAQAASRWALIVWDSGVVPLYSTSWDNIASQRLATTIGFVQYGVDLHFSL